MFRGRGGRGRSPRPAPYNNQWTSRPPHQSFDLWKASEIFPDAISRETKDDRVAKAIIERHSQLIPPAAEMTACTDLLSKITTLLDNIIVTQTGKDEHALEEVRPVGNHKLGIGIAGDKAIELVIIFKKWPSRDAIQAVADQVKAELTHTASSLEVVCGSADLTVKCNDVTATCHAATLPDSWIEPDLPGQVDVRAIEFGLAQIRHTRWFEENISHTSTRMLCRILMEISQRVSGFQPVSPWMAQLLAHQSSMVPGQRDALPIADSLRRALQFLASGYFLEPNLGVVDPCEPNCQRVHLQLESKHQDDLCCAAQTLLRWLCHGAERQVLGLDRHKGAEITMTVKCRGVIVEPAAAVVEEASEAGNGGTLATTVEEATG